MDMRITSISACKEYLIKYQRKDHNELFTNNKKDFTCKIESGNEEALEFKEEIVEGKTSYIFSKYLQKDPEQDLNKLLLNFQSMEIYRIEA